MSAETVSIDVEDTTTNTNNLIANVLFSLVAGLICLVGFAVFRVCFKRIYQTRIYVDEKWAEANLHIEKKHRSWFQWLIITIRFPESELLKGPTSYDAVMYLRFLKYTLWWLCAMSLYAILVLFPVNATSPEYNQSTDQEFNMRGIEILSVSNIAPGSARLWAHTLSVLLFTGLTWIYMNWLYMAACVLDDRVNKETDHENKTVMVTGIPKPYRSSRELRDFFVQLYGEETVVSASVVPHVESLHNLWLDYKKLQVIKSSGPEITRMHAPAHKFQEKLKEAQHYLAQFQKRPRHRPGCFSRGYPACEAKVDSINTYQRQLEAVRAEMEEIAGLPLDSTSVGFVTFSNVFTAVQTAQTLLYQDSTKMHIRYAPSPDEIDWEVVTRHQWNHFRRHMTVWSAMVVLFLFWSIPITFLTGLSTLRNLEKVKGFEWIAEWTPAHPTAKAAIEGTLSALIMNIFLSILPYLIRALLKHYGFTLWSELDRSTTRVYHLFLFLNFFLNKIYSAGSVRQRPLEAGCSLTGDLTGNLTRDLWRLLCLSSFTHAQVSVVSSSSLLTFCTSINGCGIALSTEMLFTMGNKLATQSYFFINFIIVQGFAIYPFFWLVRADEWALIRIKRLFIRTRAGQEACELDPIPFNYPLLFSRELLVVNLCLTFSSSTPIILLFGAAYFAIAFLTHKYNFIYVFARHPYPGVRNTRIGVDRIFAGLIVYQITMMGLFTTRRFPAGLIATFVVLLLSLAFRWWLYNKYFKAAKFPPLIRCSKDITPVDPSHLTRYNHPALQLAKSVAEHAAGQNLLLDEEEEAEDGPLMFRPPSRADREMVNIVRQTSDPELRFEPS